MARYKNTGLTPVPLTSGRMLDIAEIVEINDPDFDLSVEDSRIVPVPDRLPYDQQTVEALAGEADGRRLEVKGSGQGGKVIKGDLIQALEADDERAAHAQAAAAAAAAAAANTETVEVAP